MVHAKHLAKMNSLLSLHAFLLGYSGFAMVREPGVQHGEKHH